KAEPSLKLKTLQISSAMAKGVWQIVQDMRLKLVVVWSQTGSTARLFSKFRMSVPVVALSSDHRALRRMALHYGVIPQEMAPPADMASLAQDDNDLMTQKQWAPSGSRIIIVAGSSLGTPSTLNGVVIHTIGETWKP